MIILITNGVSIASFISAFGAPVRVARVNFSLKFSLTTGIVKKLLKTTPNKKKKYNKIVMLARIKLNSIDSTISKALIGNEINHENCTTNINEERNYRDLKESITMMKCQRSDMERNKLKMAKE